MHPELELAVPVARALSPRDGGSWEGVGVRPDVECPADEALDRALALAARWAPARVRERHPWIVGDLGTVP